ncbi:hypothetical protein [Dictyobacter arantiisoli]|uniref:Uncharacterized protein n=1 Tax=Dictyobacter arantiisoli TaxID=2014874 RepID=A0A5A5TGR6_9CHLR|nr:hypothetical protein [Dictyobacter arantiisoli]GCF10346.1 hypothetical protein KDI_39100 [Dictyobacter arantiisoli]
MASAESQKPTCPVCNQADQVKTMQAAYNTGVTRCAPPDMPVRNVSMMKTIILCGVALGVCIFLIITLIGGLESSLPQIAQLIIVVVTLILIVSALVSSYRAFQRIVTGDDEATLLFPAWDKATSEWKNLYYCARNDVVFDPQTNQTVSDAQLAKLRDSTKLGVTPELHAAVQH